MAKPDASSDTAVDRLSAREWELLDRLLRHGALAPPTALPAGLEACADPADLDALCRAGLIRPVTAVRPTAAREAEAYVISDWGELRWRQERRRRRRRQIADEAPRTRVA